MLLRRRADADTDALVANASNTYITGATSPVAGVATNPDGGLVLGTGTYTVDATTDYAWDYSRTYTLTCVASAGTAPNRTAEFEVEVSATSGGNSQSTNLPFHTSATTPIIQIAESGSTNLNVALDDNTHYKAGALLPFTSISL